MKVKRSASNPILKPNKEQSWEAEAVFNGCPAKKGKSTYLLYRALSLPHYHTLVNAKMMLSDIGIAKSKNGIDFEDRQRFIVPEHHWERFGCEDPRVTKLDGKYYIFYTALSSYPFGAEGIKIGLAISQNLKTVEKKHLITPFNAKAMALFPEKINNRYWAVLTVHTDRPPAKICLASFNKEEDLWSKKHWEAWYQNFDQFSLPLLRQPQDHLEVGSPPLKTERGWLLIYSYIQNYFSSQKLFTVEAALLDLENPQSIIGRTSVPILTPEKYYEKNGLVPDVIFPSGALIEGSRLNIYYGAADTTCCLATLRLSSLLDQMTKKKREKNWFKTS
ncbi:MAG: hypothetical protein ABIB61_03115 [Candidatus Shapirobacteria bacterium]